MRTGPVWSVDGHLVHVSEEGALELVDPDTGDDALAPPLDFAPSGLVRTVQNAAEILCRTDYGLVHVAVELWEQEPPLDPAELADWEDVAEVPLSWQGAAMEVWGDPYQDAETDLAVPIPGPGGYRLRVAGRHRDASPPRETYRLQLWPADHRPVTVHKRTSATAAYWAARTP